MLATTWRGNEDLRGMLVPIADLDEDPDNARVHPEANLTAVRQSYDTFGQAKPLVAWRSAPDARLMVIAGNGSLRSAKALGWSHLAVSVFVGDKYAARAYALADNRAPELAQWDAPRVQFQMEEIAAAWKSDEQRIEWSPSVVGFSVETLPFAPPAIPTARDRREPVEPRERRAAPPLPTEEASITINGVRLDSSQALYVRAAVENALHELTDPTYFASVGEIAPAYRAGLEAVRGLM